MEIGEIDPQYLETQAGLCELLDVNTSTLNNWIKRRQQTGFPPERDRIGKYAFYDVREVKRWYALWTKATKNKTKGVKNAARSSSASG